MTVKPRKLCITLLYIYIYICALTYIRWSYVHTPISQRIYIATQLSIVLICLIYIVLSSKVFRVRFLPILLGGMMLYEIIISAVRGLFVTPNFFMDALPWPLVLIVFYHYSNREQLPSCFKGISITGLILVCILSLPNIFMRELSGTGIFATYYCISMLAMVYFFVNDNKVCGVFSALVGILMVLTAKRGAVIVIALGVGMYYLLRIQQEEQDIKRIRKMSGYIISIMVIALVGIYLINSLNLNILDRLLSMTDDGGSGRTRIWESVLDFYNNSTRREQLFGNGFHAVYYRVRPFGISRYAHNSYIETLYDYGIVGTALLLMFVLFLLFKFIKIVRKKNKAAPAMGFTIIIMLVLSLVSYFFEQSVMITPLCVIWGVCLNK